MFKIEGSYIKERGLFLGMMTVKQAIDNKGKFATPFYQRGVVISRSKKMALIHSIEEDRRLAPVILSYRGSDKEPVKGVFTLETGRFNVIDGLQRLHVIEDSKNLKFAFPVVVYFGLTDREETEIFRSQGEATMLSAGDYLNASLDPVGDFYRESLENKHFPLKIRARQSEDNLGTNAWLLIGTSLCSKYLPQRKIVKDKSLSRGTRKIIEKDYNALPKEAQDKVAAAYKDLARYYVSQFGKFSNAASVYRRAVIGAIGLHLIEFLNTDTGKIAVPTLVEKRYPRLLNLMDNDAFVKEVVRRGTSNRSDIMILHAKFAPTFDIK